MVMGLGSKRRVAEGGTEPDEEESSEEYEVEEVCDHIASSRGSRLALFGSDLRLGRFRPRRRRRRPLAGEGAAEGFLHDLVIHPDNRYVIDAVPCCPRDIVNLLSKLPVSRAGCRLFWKLAAAKRRGALDFSVSSDRMAPPNRPTIDRLRVYHPKPILFSVF
jgi:hypothetical protein